MSKTNNQMSEINLKKGKEKLTKMKIDLKISIHYSQFCHFTSELNIFTFELTFHHMEMK